MQKTLLVALEDDPTCRIDVFLKHKLPDHSRAYFQELLDQNLVHVNNSLVKKRAIIKPGDRIELEIPILAPMIPTAENIPLEILYEDDALIAINKSRNFVVHPAVGHPNHTVVNALLHHYQGLEGLDIIRPGIVHRLDKDTSGILLVAKTRIVHEKLSLAFKSRQIHKEYLALCYGNPQVKMIEGSIGRDPHDRKKMALTENGKESSSAFEVISYYQGYSLVKITPHTGRTHQIRVHLQAAKAPILGDPLYGIAKINEQLHVSHQMLHAHLLRFSHPITQKTLTLTAPLPQDMLDLQKKLLLQ